MSRKIPRLTIPLFPLLRPGAAHPSIPKRLRPADTLDFAAMADQLKPGTLITIPTPEGRWAVVSVFSPYSPDLHVMVLEESNDRYLPGPEMVPDPEGEILMDIWLRILAFMKEETPAGSLHLGYNWSPLAWGAAEEKGGFQSIPTKWHAMLWTWPEFPPPGKDSTYVSWIPLASLPKKHRRFLGDNAYANPLGEWLIERLGKSPMRLPAGAGSPEDMDMRVERGVITLSVPLPLQDILSAPDIFQTFFKPAAVTLRSAFRALSESFTDMDYESLTAVLKEAESGPLSADKRDILRRTPRMHEDDEIHRRFQKHGIPLSLISILKPAVEARCRRDPNTGESWRKGFGYALALRQSLIRNSDMTELHIMPGVYNGPGGVVEAQGVVLDRPEDQHLSREVQERNSRRLWKLARTLKKAFPESRIGDEPDRG